MYGNKYIIGREPSSQTQLAHFSGVLYPANLVNALRILQARDADTHVAIKSCHTEMAPTAPASRQVLSFPGNATVVVC